MRFLKKYCIYIVILNIFVDLKGESRMKLYSPSFANESAIPKKFTCEDENLSPELKWENAPTKTQVFALICDDPDAPTAEPWVHWIVFNIPSNITKLAEGESFKSMEGVSFGVGTDGNKKYNGPCPPHGHGKHRYFFKLYALDSKLNLKSKATKSDLLNAMQGHILDTAELIGIFERK